MDLPTELRQRVAEGTLAWEAEEFARALELFESVLEEHPDFSDIRNKVGLCHAMLGDWERALTAFEEAVRRAPSFAEAHVNRGIALNELGRHEEAQEAFAKSADLDVRDGREFPSNLGNQIAVTHAKLGDLYLAAERPDEAIRQYRSGLAVRPHFIDIRSKLGEALLHSGATEEARDEFLAVLETNPDFWSARLRLGIALSRLGDLSGAVREWKRCEELDPSDMRPKAYVASVAAKVDDPAIED